MPEKRTRRNAIGLAVRSEWDGLSLLKRWVLGAAALWAAVNTLYNAVGVEVKSPYYPRLLGEALAQSYYQQTVPMLQDLHRESLVSQRQYWCGQSQLANARLMANPNDDLAMQYRNTSIGMLRFYNEKLGWPPPPVTPPPQPVC